MPDLRQQLVEIAVIIKPQRPLAVFSARDHFGFDFVKRNPLAHAHLAARVHQRGPRLRVLAHGLHQQHFHNPRKANPPPV